MQALDLLRWFSLPWFIQGFTVDCSKFSANYRDASCYWSIPPYLVTGHPDTHTYIYFIDWMVDPPFSCIEARPAPAPPIEPTSQSLVRDRTRCFTSISVHTHLCHHLSSLGLCLQALNHCNGIAGEVDASCSRNSSSVAQQCSTGTDMVIMQPLTQ